MVLKILGGGGVQMGVGSCTSGQNLIFQLEWLVLREAVLSKGISSRFTPLPFLFINYFHEFNGSCETAGSWPVEHFVHLRFELIT